MALMAFREPNQVKWQGVRPAHRGTEVVKSGTANNAIVILHTVTALKTLFLTSWTLAVDAAAAGVIGQFYVRNGADVLQYNMGYIVMRTVGQLTQSWSDIQPVEISAGWDICLLTGSGNCWIWGWIHGWEE